MSSTMEQISAAKRLGSARAAKPQWQKIEAGLYESPGGEWRAKKTGIGADRSHSWSLLRRDARTGRDPSSSGTAAACLGFVRTDYCNTLAECWKKIPEATGRAAKSAAYEVRQAEAMLRLGEAQRVSLAAHGGEAGARAQLHLVEEHLDNVAKLPFREALKRLTDLKRSLVDAVAFLDDGVIAKRSGTCTSYSRPHTIEALKADVAEKKHALAVITRGDPSPGPVMCDGCGVELAVYALPGSTCQRCS